MPDTAPSLTPIQMTEHIVRTQDGLGLFVRDYAPETPVTGTPVLCMHGLTRNSRDFDGVAPRIAALGRRVICPDVRGRGRSDWDPNATNYQPVTYVHDTLRILDQLGIARCVWVGTSMGGLMTMIAAATVATRMAGVVLNDVAPVLEQAGLSRIAGYVGRTDPVATLDEAAERIRAINQPAFPTETGASFWLKFAERTFRKRPDGRFELDYDPAIATPFKAAPQTAAPDLWPVFGALADVPTLLVRGAISDLISRDTVHAMHARKSDLVSVEVADVGHAPTLEEDAAWTALWQFLARVA